MSRLAWSFAEACGEGVAAVVSIARWGIEALVSAFTEDPLSVMCVLFVVLLPYLVSATLDRAFPQSQEEVVAVEEEDVVNEFAMFNYEAFHGLPHGSVTIDTLATSSAGIAGWAACTLADRPEPVDRMDQDKPIPDAPLQEEGAESTAKVLMGQCSLAGEDVNDLPGNESDPPLICRIQS